MNAFRVLTIAFFFFIHLIPEVLAESNSKEIKIGAVTSLTGFAVKDGTNWLEGATLAVDELNSSGKKVRLIVEDDRTSPAMAASAFTKLATVDKVSGIIGGTWDFLAEAVYPLAKQYSVPFITPTNPVEILSEAVRANPWVFTNGLSLAAESEVVEKFMRSRKVASAALAYVNVPYGTSNAAMVKEISKRLGVKIVLDLPIEYAAYAEMVRFASMKISESKPDMVFIVTGYDGADQFLRELERVHVNPTVLMTHCLKAAYDYGGSPTRYSNSFGIYSKSVSPGFNQAFLRKYHRPPYDYAPVGYDAVMFMAKLIEARAERDIKEVALKYEGITGVHELPSASPEVARGPAAIMGLRDGELEEVSYE